MIRHLYLVSVDVMFSYVVLCFDMSCCHVSCCVVLCCVILCCVVPYSGITQFLLNTVIGTKKGVFFSSVLCRLFIVFKSQKPL